MTQKPNANICLIFSPDIERDFTELAQKYFKGQTEGYCLDENQVFPHITLAQIAIQNEAQQQHIFQSIAKITPDPIELTSFQVKFRQTGFLWFEFVVSETDSLMLLKDNIDQMVREIGLEPLNNAIETYQPHVTLARMKANCIFPPIVIPESIAHKSFKVSLTCGRSDENGQLLLRTLDDNKNASFPSSQPQ